MAKEQTIENQKKELQQLAAQQPEPAEKEENNNDRAENATD